jgi:hypothetical protein
MDAPILARLAAIKDMPTPELKAMWRDLYSTEPPPYNRRFLESRLAYRIQELAYGGLSRDAAQRLEALAEDFSEINPMMRKIRTDRKPIVGTKLIRDWKGTEHIVVVREDGYDYQGRLYKSLSIIARTITGTVWNGWIFFGLKQPKGRKQ